VVGNAHPTPHLDFVGSASPPTASVFRGYAPWTRSYFSTSIYLLTLCLRQSAETADLPHGAMGQRKGIGFPVSEERRADSNLDLPSPAPPAAVSNPHGDKRNRVLQFRLELEDHLNQPALARAHRSSNISPLRKNDHLFIGLQAGDQIPEGVQGPDRSFPIKGDSAQQGEIGSDTRSAEKLLLRNKVKGITKRKTDERDIRPVLVLRQDDSRAICWKRGLPLNVDPVKERKKNSGNLSRYRVNQRVPSHDPSAESQFGGDSQLIAIPLRETPFIRRSV
jgi:hypothetical protein